MGSENYQTHEITLFYSVSKCKLTSLKKPFFIVSENYLSNVPKNPSFIVQEYCLPNVWKNSYLVASNRFNQNFLHMYV